jgi:ComF family protein
LTQRPPFEKASAYGSYQGGVHELINLLTYDRVLPAARVLGRLAEAVTDLAPDFGAELPPVVPVPLHESKFRQRTFNQSELMAGALIKAKPLDLMLELAPKLLMRRRSTGSRNGLTRHQRVVNMRGAFRAMSRNEINRRDILLVDDVFTTGTTVSECARVLRRAGANKVWVATVARTEVADDFHAPRGRRTRASTRNGGGLSLIRICTQRATTRSVLR